MGYLTSSTGQTVGSLSVNINGVEYSLPSDINEEIVHIDQSDNKKLYGISYDNYVSVVKTFIIEDDTSELLNLGSDFKNDITQIHNEILTSGTNVVSISSNNLKVFAQNLGYTFEYEYTETSVNNYKVSHNYKTLNHNNNLIGFVGDNGLNVSTFQVASINTNSSNDLTVPDNNDQRVVTKINGTKEFDVIRRVVNNDGNYDAIVETFVIIDDLEILNISSNETYDYYTSIFSLIFTEMDGDNSGTINIPIANELLTTDFLTEMNNTHDVVFSTYNTSNTNTYMINYSTELIEIFDESGMKLGLIENSINRIKNRFMFLFIIIVILIITLLMLRKLL